MKQDNFLKIDKFYCPLPIHSTTSLVNIRETHHEKLYGLWIPQTHSNSAIKIFNNAFYAIKWDSLGQDWNLAYTH